MKLCKLCRKPYRTGRVAHVMGGPGKLTCVRVCKGCASDGVLVVAAEKAPLCKCGEPAKLCSACATDAGRNGKAADVSGAIKTLHGMCKVLGIVLHNESNKDAAGYEHVRGKVEGIESAIELLESGRW